MAGLDWPGAMSPVSSEPSFRTMWCVTLSEFCHATMPPSATAPGLGAKDWAPRLPWMLMETTRGVEGVGVGGVGLFGELLEPPQVHAVSATTIEAARAESRMIPSLHLSDDDG